jgi:hypothetical protein
MLERKRPINSNLRYAVRIGSGIMGGLGYLDFYRGGTNIRERISRLAVKGRFQFLFSVFGPEADS